MYNVLYYYIQVACLGIFHERGLDNFPLNSTQYLGGFGAIHKQLFNEYTLHIYTIVIMMLTL